MTYLDLAAQLVMKLEDLRLEAYPDSVGKPTIGWGHTGQLIHIPLSISEATARAWLASDMLIASTRLHYAVTPAAFAALTDHQKAALVSFVFNLGEQPSWTIWRDVNAGKLDDVPTQMLRFVHGVVDNKLVEIAGLVNRRKAEIAFWNTPDSAQPVQGKDASVLTAADAAAIIARQPQQGLAEADKLPT